MAKTRKATIDHELNTLTTQIMRHLMELDVGFTKDRAPFGGERFTLDLPEQELEKSRVFDRHLWTPTLVAMRAAAPAPRTLVVHVEGPRSKKGLRAIREVVYYRPRRDGTINVPLAVARATMLRERAGSYLTMLLRARERADADYKVVTEELEYPRVPEGLRVTRRPDGRYEISLEYRLTGLTPPCARALLGAWDRFLVEASDLHPESTEGRIGFAVVGTTR